MLAYVTNIHNKSDESPENVYDTLLLWSKACLLTL